MSSPASSVTTRIDAVAAKIEPALERMLADAPLPGETVRPERLLAAMRHAALGGGKRLRPFLLIETARLFGVVEENALHAACALELVHCYSLVHDDLPAMDDDDLRRGRPTVHRAFDEATAILAGDTLQTLAFDVLAMPETHPDPAIRLELVTLLARASGLGGMAGGQMLDLAAEGRFTADGKPEVLGEDAILRLQSMKTGALIRAAVAMGAALGQADSMARNRLDAYACAIGAAFQIADDLLDLEGDAEVIGKATGKDAGKGKATLVGLWGIERSRTRLAALAAGATEALNDFGSEAETLCRIAHYMIERNK